MVETTTLLSTWTAMTPRQRDAWVAEKVMGWRRVQAPRYDYDGPLPEQGEVLVPPGFIENSYTWPPRGVVSFDAFIRNSYTTTPDADYLVLCRVRETWDFDRRRAFEAYLYGIWFRRRGSDFIDGNFDDWEGGICYLPGDYSMAAYLAVEGGRG